jgi:nicotinamide-nucleotide amidase
MSQAAEKLAYELGEKLKANNKKVVTAESCTGGGVGFWLTSIPGSSDWYERGYITYSNEAKMELINVAPETLDMFGAVSEQTAREMAEGALNNSHADYSIAITGIAGPDGGSKDKPVGTVWIAYAGKALETVAEVDVFPGDRQDVRQGVIEHALKRITELAN